MIKEINDYESILNLASECFYNEPFYEGLTKEEIKKYFEKSLNEIKNIKKIFIYELNDSIVGFIILFNYNELKKNKESFNIIFPNIEEINDEVKILNNLIKDDENCYMILAIGVSSNYRLKGIATNLISFAKKLNGNIIVDVSNKKSINAYLKNNFSLIKETEKIAYLKYVKQFAN